ncbi:MAG: hypothetical protein OXE96_06045 [Gemmatimonadetes bacterium]|nr:hypothetical protein [Gemmatimonadota bacterium]
MRKQLIAAIAAGTVACQQDGGAPTAPGSEVRDSAGIRIVENPQPPDGSRLGWRVGPEPAVSIGVLEGEEPYMLHWVADAIKLPDGRIVVANGGTEEVRVFDGDGHHLTTWGGEGDGPGEFRSLAHVAPWPGDSIAAWYSGRLGIAVFDYDGNFGRSFVLGSSETAVWLRPRPHAVRETGVILAITAPESADTAVVEIRDGEGALSASLGTHPGAEVIITTNDEGATYVSWKIYGRELVAGLWGDQIVVSPNDRYEIRAFRADGTLARIVRRDHVPRAPIEADRAPWVEEQLSFYREANVPEAMWEQARQEFENTPLAQTFPAFSSVMTDATGHLWVEEYEFPREDRPGVLWTVFDPTGRVLGFVETPEGLEIFEIGEDYILGSTEDEFEVEYVQMWPLER